MCLEAEGVLEIAVPVGEGGGGYLHKERVCLAGSVVLNYSNYRALNK